ncbi:MAG: sigma-54 dependent transcriptional regulator [Nitrospirota bacterium]
MGNVFARPRKLTIEAESLQMMGRSPLILKVFREIERIRSRDTAVFISGEVGTGKKLAAKLIHHNSPRSEGPFVVVNSESIPEELLEIELFGIEKDPSTGVSEKRTGKIEAAESGTLFLNEIAGLDSRLQEKILRFIIEKEFIPAGSDRKIKSNVRMIIATKRDPKEIVASGLLKEDLYHYLQQTHIKLPLLKERKEDILPLAKHFLKETTERFQTGSKEFTKEVKDLLLKYDWPGNVGELKYAITRASLISRDSAIKKGDLLIEDISLYSIKEFLERKLKHYLKSMTKLESSNLYDVVFSEVERSLLSIVLKETEGNQLKAAKILGINRNTLRAKIKEYKISL